MKSLREWGNWGFKSSKNISMLRHTPVLLNEVIENLNLKKRSNVIDCTLGDGGHTEKILEKIESGKLLGIDNDIESVLRSKSFLYRFEDNFIAVRDNFTNLKKIVEDKQFKPVNGILIDLGWSSPQFAERERGFSFRNLEEDLDMRYNKEEDVQKASDILNEYTEEELERIFRRYGEEKKSRAIAKAIVKYRKDEKMLKVGQLVDLTMKVIGRHEKIHPATRIFQALRIEVNKELEVLKDVLPQAIEVLSVGGRLVVISFHSLEDRIVKQYFKKIELDKTIKIISKKPILASVQELKDNPRARSAKLRVIEKIS